MGRPHQWVTEPYVDSETERLANINQCPICGPNHPHTHRLDAGELREVERIEAQYRGKGRPPPERNR